ncbi:MAG: SIS domain-containing protein [Treponema sp.]|jgi:tagatose-6-phosphate ketose/aldose isomerase|nr:SIS domain-containing protein [Treponema sp.]
MDTWEVFYGLDEAYFSSKNCIFTSAEIARQSALWRNLGVILSQKRGEILAFIKKMGGLEGRRIVLTGAGSSAYAGEAAAMMVGKSAGLRAESVHTTDIVSVPHSVLFPDLPTLLISFGRSGNSPESIGAVEYARKIVKDLYEIALVCDYESKLAKITAESGRGLAFIMPEGSCDKGFAMTSSFTCMTLACCAVLGAGNFDTFIEDIGRLAAAVDGKKDALVTAARKWAAVDYDRLIVLGSGCQKGLAREGALKSMELTTGIVNTGWDSPMGFRHGPKAVITDKTLTVHFISPDPFTARYDLDLLAEICRQKKGNRVIALSGEKLSIPVDENIVIGGENYGFGQDICRGLSYLFFCQLLAMFKSLALGLSTDNPVPTGELTRVVSGVTLYDLKD